MVVQHRSALPGVEAMTLLADHAFPRHSHDGFGIGIITAGAQRSWSGIGPVESTAGDVITVNPGEMHDGTPISGAREWRMLYADALYRPCLGYSRGSGDRRGRLGDRASRVP